jgi:DNA-binding GntR family transcriptional regulator
MTENLIHLPRVQDWQALAQNVATSVEKAIIFGEIPGGTRLTEKIICQKTGVSRSPIREALQILERDGLLHREPRKGVRVAELTLDDLDELYACRISLEVTAAQLAAKKASSDEIEGIRKCRSDCERMFKRNDVLGHFQANVEMSQRIFEAAHNQVLSKLLGSIQKQALRYRFFAYQKSKAARQFSISSNAELVEALAQRHAQKAGETMRRSIEASHEIIRECLSQHVRRNVRLASGMKG